MIKSPDCENTILIESYDTQIIRLSTAKKGRDSNMVLFDVYIDYKYIYQIICHRTTETWVIKTMKKSIDLFLLAKTVLDKPLCSFLTLLMYKTSNLLTVVQ